MDAMAFPLRWQFTLAYLLVEVALIAIALSSARLATSPWGGSLELRVGLYCIALVASVGALGGVCFRMSVGLVAGGVFAVASMPLLLTMIGAMAR